MPGPGTSRRRKDRPSLNSAGPTFRDVFAIAEFRALWRAAWAATMPAVLPGDHYVLGTAVTITTIQFV